MKVNAFGVVVRVAFVVWTVFCGWNGCVRAMEIVEPGFSGNPQVSILVATGFWLVAWFIIAAALGLAYVVLGRSKA